MENPYSLHFYSGYQRQDALRDARRRHLMVRARASRRSRSGRSRMGPILTSMLLLRGRGVAT